MIDPSEDAAAIVAKTLSHRSPGDRATFLRELLAHTAAGIVILEGDTAAAEAVYRVADAVVKRAPAGPSIDRRTK